jgi:hypothetical protein
VSASLGTSRRRRRLSAHAVDQGGRALARGGASPPDRGSVTAAFGGHRTCPPREHDLSPIRARPTARAQPTQRHRFLSPPSPRWASIRPSIRSTPTRLYSIRRSSATATTAWPATSSELLQEIRDLGHHRRHSAWTAKALGGTATETVVSRARKVQKFLCSPSSSPRSSPRPRGARPGLKDTINRFRESSTAKARSRTCRAGLHGGRRRARC